MAQIELDICTPEGKTWLAEVDGVGGRHGLSRRFINAARQSTSSSGRTGTATYVVDDGFFESNEGRKRLGRRYWRVEGGRATEIDLAALTKALTSPPARPTLADLTAERDRLTAELERIEAQISSLQAA